MASDSEHTYSLTFSGGGDLDLVTAQAQQVAHIENAGSYRIAGALLAQVIERIRAIEAWYAEERQPFADVTKILRAREKASLEPWQALQDVLQTAMREYETQSKAARRSALTAALEAASEGEMPVSLSQLAAEQAVPEVEGLQSREIWSAEVTNFSVLVVTVGLTTLLEIWDQMLTNVQGPPDPVFVGAVKAFIEQWVEQFGRVEEEALQPNQPWLNSKARTARSALKIAGVVPVKRDIYAKGRK